MKRGHIPDQDEDSTKPSTVFKRQRGLTYEDYTIGWVCALAEELTAAMAILDDIHPDLPSRGNDQNIYTLGSIGGHNIVIACLPMGKYGTTPAAVVGTQMLEQFPSVRFGLMVGIGGGIFEKGVRLGDVVVGTPGNGHPGVVQSDLGKAESTGFFPTSALNNPPNTLLAAVNKLIARRPFNGPMMEQYIEEAKAKWCHLSKRFTRPSEGEGSASLESIERAPGLSEKRQVNESVKIHYGLIASGNQVIKDEVRRDELNRTFHGRILCVEMEAAGLLYNFPCIVVRGICDYADSTKNDDWHDYAAIMAAAYAKELLQYVLPVEVKSSHRIKDILDQTLDTMSATQKNVSQIHSGLRKQEEKRILDWLTDVEYGPQHYGNLQAHQPETGQWFLASQEYQKWLNSSGQILFCPGMPGAGKTVLSAVVIRDLHTRYATRPQYGIAYMYLSYQQQDRIAGDAPALSLLKQLLGQSESTSELETLHFDHQRRDTRPSSAEIRTLLWSTIAQFSQTFIVIDAVDECSSFEDRSELLALLFQLRAEQQANIFVTSRFIESITREFNDCITLEIRAMEDDVLRYLDANIKLADSILLRSNLRLQEKVKDGIIELVDGMFLLAKLYLETFKFKITERDIDDALAELGSLQNSVSGGKEAILSKAYDQVIERIRHQGSDHLNLAKKVLLWITWAESPLTANELRYLLAVEPGQLEVDERNFPQIEDMLSVCLGLVIVDNQEGGTLRLIHYTAQEYFESEKTEPLISETEAYITNVCITYLSFENPPCMICFHMHDPRQCCSRESYKYNYAARKWVYHAQRATTSVQEVVAFLSSHGDGLPLSTSFGSDAYSPNYRGSGLHIATYHGLHAVVEGLIKGHNFDSKDSFGRTPIFWAAKQGRVSIARLLSQKGADPNTSDNQGHTPLSVAAEVGYTQIVNLFLGYHFVSIDSWTRDGRTLFSYAARNNHRGVMELLLRKGANPDAVDQRHRTPLLHAASWGCNDAVELLLTIPSVNRNHQDDEGKNAIFLAAERGSDEITQLLISEGVNIEAEDFRGETPLFAAVRNKHEQVVQLLCDRNLSTNHRNRWGYTPLLIAAQKGNASIVKLLISHNADPYASDNYGCTPLQMAALHGDTDIVKLLIAYNADPPSLDNHGRTPLHIAAEKPNTNVVELLLEHNADPSAVDDHGCTPLHVAAKKGNTDVAKLLIAHKADPNSVNNHSRTPLHVAAQKGHTDMVKLLLAHDADPNSLDDNGCTPLALATRNAHSSIHELLTCTDFTNQYPGPERLLLEAFIRKSEKAIVALVANRHVSFESFQNGGLGFLLPAVNSGSSAALKALIARGVNCSDYRNRHGQSILWEAVEIGDANIVKVLLETEHFNLRFTNAPGRSLLWLSIDKRHLHVTRLLLETGGIELDYPNRLGQTPLAWASGEGEEKILSSILSHDCIRVNSRDKSGRTPLHHAARNGHHGVVMFLLAKDSLDLNAQDVCGETPLSVAAKNGHDQVVRILLDRNDINPVLEDENNSGPLEFAIRNGHVNVVKLLLEETRVINAYQAEEKAVRLAHATADTTTDVLEVVCNSAL